MTATGRLSRVALVIILASCSLLRGSSWLKIHDQGLLPIEVGKVSQALWVEYGWSDPADGLGIAFLVMVDKDLDCDQLLDTFGSYAWLYGSSTFNGASGMLGYFSWWHDDDVNAGFEGLYATGGYAYSDQGELERRMLPLLMGDGQMYFSYGGIVGVAEVTAYSDSQVVGTVSTDLVDAAFTAENCGRAETEYYGYDDDEEDYGYYEAVGVTP